MRSYFYCSAAAAMLITASINTVAEPCREILLGYTSGDIDGYPQGPANIGSINGMELDADDRFNALGFDDFHQWNLEGRYDYGRNRFYLAYDRTRLNRDVDLEPPVAEDYIGTTSPTGYIAAYTPTRYSIQLDYYRLGYQRLFTLSLFGRQLTLAPGLEMDVLNFDFEQDIDITLIPVPTTSESPIGIFSSGGFTAADPTIAHPVIAYSPDATKWGLRIGSRAEYQLSERLALTAELYDTASIDDWPDVFTGKFGVRYQLYDGNKGAVYLFARGGAETIKLNRGDTPWNDVHAEYRDLLQGGVSVRF